MTTAAVTTWLVHYQQCSNSQVTQVIIYLLRLKNVTGTGLDNWYAGHWQAPSQKDSIPGSLFNRVFYSQDLWDFLVLGHNWAHALARCSRLLRTASPRLHFVQHKNAWVSNTNQSYFSFLQVSFIYSIQNKELIDGKIFGSQSKALDKIWIDKKGGVATFLLKAGGWPLL